MVGRIASGEIFGPNRKKSFSNCWKSPGMPNLEGVAMDWTLQLPTLQDIIVTAHPNKAFKMHIGL